MSPDPFYTDVARIALAVAERHGFVLGGGFAWLMNGLVERPTEDVDLFTDTEGAAGAAADAVCAALRGAGYTVHEEEADDLLELFAGFDQREFTVGDGARTVRLTLSRLDRQQSPVMMDVGPVMHLDDLIATKVAALVNRREVRDYIDVAAALDRYGVDELLDLARRQDPALEDDDILAAGRYLDRLDDGRFTFYGLTPDRIAALRAKLKEWPR
ncbi:nucleotidyl transferase AbiEii/AbiGii toxin family protein [Dactylosporangium sp. AC04546]|uniref:nucleotidyl transferase AbiEii/AbiGii toxin family protein n=1 Tax=Dactylosporangium sp. AC04546 TaxID=2862460 RepID=UPI001EDD40FB|nr:nucleotidyl transferase AbiEii/AbiGii toxin family protein [Dactylosporangium sp. AC04546]WVK89353.1 nucleotidyl transferase AbiEii/AbiGii toxin family protein [Dactylosporangium sp. AC04546]